MGQPVLEHVEFVQDFDEFAVLAGDLEFSVLGEDLYEAAEEGLEGLDGEEGGEFAVDLGLVGGVDQEVGVAVEQGF